MRVLLVDDSRTMRTILKRVLASLGAIDFAEAGDGAEALDLMAQTPGGFDFVLVDWNMPVMDGITFVKRVRETDKKTVLVMVTMECEKGQVMEAIKAGVNNYVIKPFTPEMLTDKVKQTLEKSRAAA